MEVNEAKRQKFMEYAGKRVNNVLHDIQILEPMSRSSSYDFTRQDVEEMFSAMQETLDNAKAEFEKKFDEKARSEKKVFSFGSSTKNIAIVESENNIATGTEASTLTAEVVTEAELAESQETEMSETEDAIF